jgi:antitoxin component of RelBE/YafQ-DinJ toxin-antitoxin module
MDARQLSFRIDREIAEKALRMAAQRGMELPEVMRMMLTKAVRIGDFMLDAGIEPPPVATTDHPNYRYEERYWAPMKASLDAEAAMAVLNRAIAQRTAWLDEASSAKSPDLKRLERIRDERDHACALLASFDPSDNDAVAEVFEAFGSPSIGQSERPESGKAE